MCVQKVTSCPTSKSARLYFGLVKEIVSAVAKKTPNIYYCTHALACLCAIVKLYVIVLVSVCLVQEDI